MSRGGLIIKGLLSLSFALLLSWLLRDWALSSPYFCIEQIRVEGNRLLPPEEVRQLAQPAKGVNIFRFNASQIEGQLEANPIVKRAVVVKRPPHLIEIRIEEKEPLFLVNRGGNLLVQGNGFTVDPRSPIDLPIFSGGDDLGERYAAELALQMRREDPTLLDMVSQIKWEKGITLWLQNGCRVELGEGNFGEKASHLRELLPILKEAGDNPGFIDLRFRDQAVVSKGRKL